MRVKARILTALAILVASVSVAGEPLMFNDWGVARSDDGNSVSAITMVSEQAGLGEWCFYSSKTCTWELLVNITCQVGEEHLVLANSTTDYASLKVSCLGKSERGPLYVYSFNWKDLEALIKSPSNASKVAFAMPLQDSEFRVIRFSLNGVKEATGMLERRFFKGAQPASLNDQTL
jgi:hypothetical protein